MIKIDFEMTDGIYFYRDAIHLPEDHILTDEEIESIKQARFDRWLEVITAPSVFEETPVDVLAPDPVVEDIPAQE